MRLISGRGAVVGGMAAVVVALCSGTVFAKGKIELTYSDAAPLNDFRSTTLRKEFGECLGDEFDFKPYHSATLFKQGTELTAMQRGNLDMSMVAIYDLYNQVPEASILGVSYLYKSYDHMRKVWDSGILDDLMRTIENKAKIVVLANPYLGTRHVNIKGDRKVMIPADLAGIKLRMPGGEGWQFVGKALGANPTAIAFTEVYTALQTGAIDGQENPLATDQSMKFYEVTDQIILTGHLISASNFSLARSKWDTLNAGQQARVRKCATNFRRKLDEYTLQREATLIDFFKEKGLKVYEPDKNAFRAHVLEMFRNSKYSADWPAGLLDKINNL